MTAILVRTRGEVAMATENVNLGELTLLEGVYFSLDIRPGSGDSPVVKVKAHDTAKEQAMSIECEDCLPHEELVRPGQALMDIALCALGGANAAYGAALEQYLTPYATLVLSRTRGIGNIGGKEGDNILFEVCIKVPDRKSFKTHASCSINFAKKFLKLN